MMITRSKLRHIISEKIDQEDKLSQSLDVGSNIHIGNFSDVRKDYTGTTAYDSSTPYYIIPEYMGSESEHVTDTKDPYVYIYNQERDAFKIVGSPLHPKLGLKSLGAVFKQGDVAYNILFKRVKEINEVKLTSKNSINRLIKEEILLLITEDRNRDLIIEKSKALNELDLEKDFINDEILDSIISIGEPFIETFKNDITNYFIEKYEIGEELGTALIDVIQDSSISDIKQYFTPEGCNDFSNRVFDRYSSKTSLDINPLIDDFIAQTGLVGVNSDISNKIKIEISSRISSEEISQIVKDEMASIACSIDLEDVAETFKTQISDYVSNLVDDVPDWLSGAMDMGGDIVSDITSRAQDMFGEER
tara:strand:- start:14047 stop:15132 length:1086 start_codon:yes stop_codon:yes gene_type:complete